MPHFKQPQMPCLRQSNGVRETAGKQPMARIMQLGVACSIAIYEGSLGFELPLVSGTDRYSPNGHMAGFPTQDLCIGWAEYTLDRPYRVASGSLLQCICAVIRRGLFLQQQDLFSCSAMLGGVTR